MTRMFRSPSWRCWTTQSIAAMTWLTSVPPSATPTLTLTIRAPGAMPRYAGELAAMRPAMNVPCPFVSRSRKSGDWDSSDRSGP